MEREKICFRPGRRGESGGAPTKSWKAPMRLSSIPRVNSNHRKRRFAANGSRMDTGVKRKWRLVRGRVAYSSAGVRLGGKTRMKNSFFSEVSVLFPRIFFTLRISSTLNACTQRFEVEADDWKICSY